MLRESARAANTGCSKPVTSGAFLSACCMGCVAGLAATSASAASTRTEWLSKWVRGTVNPSEAGVSAGVRKCGGR